MNKIEKMVKELCPDGIEFRSIGSLIKRYNKKAKNITDIKVYSVSKNEGLIPADEYREHIIHSQDTSNYTIMYKINLPHKREACFLFLYLTISYRAVVLVDVLSTYHLLPILTS